MSPTFIGWMQVVTGSLYGAILTLAVVFLLCQAALWACTPRRVAAQPERAPQPAAVRPRRLARVVNG